MKEDVVAGTQGDVDFGIGFSEDFPNDVILSTKMNIPVLKQLLIESGFAGSKKKTLRESKLEAIDECILIICNTLKGSLSKRKALKVSSALHEYKLQVMDDKDE